MSTFVSVGNATQPFLRVLQGVAAAVPGLPGPVFVQYGAASGFACAGPDCAAFIAMDEFSARVEAATLVILHAGAGSVIHAVRAGKVPVVMPRRAALGEHVDDHQVEFARALGQLGRVIVCEDASQLLSCAQQALQRQAGLLTAAQDPPLVDHLRHLPHLHATSLC